MIYHLLTKGEWEKAKKEEVYWPESLDKEGFIHCLTKDQLLKAGSGLLPNEAEAVLLKVNSHLLESLVVFEDLSELGEMYPHIYGHINLEAVVAVYEMKRNQEQRFVFPEAI
ncbi:Uncharacterized conserved protein, DUF952 family [Evansella caseinilytica]|uniref:Uncharacterized conserved protein, DUF952 family n=1 Tax=Evansella caseinilytica TaxID=1503961 RepID=A0A1H3NQ65_9BACI|nr:DUF952 domain-containing protein [Evansella caseinilytica]SDY90928.1 Uncharacterized conserved protein, DUF952 family [Evansella caseinilytica]